MTSDLDFDVLLSFSGTERAYARAIHDVARANGLRVFLDEEFQHEIWGRNLVEYLDSAYRERGAYVLALISESYRDGSFTRVEYRAVFDRMIEERKEYLLPVKVDGAWLNGLPKATAYLDLRTQGVLGICEVLVKKLRGPGGKLIVPENLAIPRVPLGRLPGEQLATYLLELCARDKVAVFGALIYDERSAPLRKLLRDSDYWDALDSSSGPHFEIFALRDTVDAGWEDDEHDKIGLATAFDLDRSQSRQYYFSRLLNQYFGEEKTLLAYPSLLLFIVENRQVTHCRLIPFRANGPDETFQKLLTLSSLVAAGINEAGGSAAPSSAILWKHLKEKLLASKYTVYIQSAPGELQAALRGLEAFVEG